MDEGKSVRCSREGVQAMTGQSEERARDERRREGHPRVAVRVPTRTEPVGSVFAAFQGESENVSPGGLCLRQENSLAPGTLVRVTLRLRRHLALTVLGTVIWAHPLLGQQSWEIGIAFREHLPPPFIAEAVLEPPAA